MVSGQSCSNLNQTTKEGGAVTGSRSEKKLCTNVHACYLSVLRATIISWKEGQRWIFDLEVGTEKITHRHPNLLLQATIGR